MVTSGRGSGGAEVGIGAPGRLRAGSDIAAVQVQPVLAPKAMTDASNLFTGSDQASAPFKHGQRPWLAKRLQNRCEHDHATRAGRDRKTQDKAVRGARALKKVGVDQKPTLLES